MINRVQTDAHHCLWSSTIRPLPCVCARARDRLRLLRSQVWTISPSPDMAAPCRSSCRPRTTSTRPCRGSAGGPSVVPSRSSCRINRAATRQRLRRPPPASAPCHRASCRWTTLPSHSLCPRRLVLHPLRPARFRRGLPRGAPTRHLSSIHQTASRCSTQQALRWVRAKAEVEGVVRAVGV
jgi:hypothetical protein